MDLTDIIKRVPTLNEINGSFGEWLVKNFADLTTDALVLHDVLINGADGFTSQIDLLMIGAKGIYVIEVKMYNGAKIYGNGKKSKWYYYNHGRKYEIYSPIMQNKKHIKYLKSFLQDFGDVPCFSVVTVICDDFKVDEIGNGDTAICNSLPSMKKVIHLIADNKPVVFDEKRKQEIYDYIKSNQIEGKDSRIEHKENVIRYKENIDEMKKQKICPYCKTDLVLRKGKYGEFYGCSNYPKCRYTLKS